MKAYTAENKTARRTGDLFKRGEEHPRRRAANRRALKKGARQALKREAYESL